MRQLYLVSLSSGRDGLSSARDDRTQRAAAEPVGPIQEDDYPIFVTGEVLRQSEAYSPKGREEEGGAWLVGNLHRQTEPRPEIFAVIHTALEARYMARERFAMTPSSQTFLRLTALRRGGRGHPRRRQPAALDLRAGGRVGFAPRRLDPVPARPVGS